MLAPTFGGAVPAHGEVLMDVGSHRAPDEAVHVMDVAVAPRFRRLGVVGSSHRTCTDVDASHEHHLVGHASVDQPDLLVLALPPRRVPPCLPPRVAAGEHPGRRLVAGEHVVGIFTRRRPLRVPEQHPHVQAPPGGPVHQVEKRAPSAGEPGTDLEERHAHPHRGLR